MGTGHKDAPHKHTWMYSRKMPEPKAPMSWLYGEPGWLEAVMEGSSEDDLERDSDRNSKMAPLQLSVTSQTLVIALFCFLTWKCYSNMSNQENQKATWSHISWRIESWQFIYWVLSMGWMKSDHESDCTWSNVVQIAVTSTYMWQLGVIKVGLGKF